MFTAWKGFPFFLIHWVFILGQIPAPAFSGEAVTFPQALEMMVSGTSLFSAASEVEQKEYEAKAARGLSFPEVTLSSQYVRIDESIDLDLNPIRDVILALHPAVPPAAVPSFHETIQEDTFFMSQLNVTWPVFTGGRLLRLRKLRMPGSVNQRQNLIRPETP